MYQYTKAPVDVERLEKEITDSTIITALDHIDLLGHNQIYIYFKDILSVEDKTLLDEIISNHTGEPLIRPEPVKEVVTQYEKNDKDLKLSRGVVEIENGYARLSVRVPGDINLGEGRYVAGGYAILQDYDPDDYTLVHVCDDDRIVAWAIALSQDPNASAPIPDEMIRGMGPVPGFGRAFPEYPMIKSYTDLEMPEANQGWYFWPNALGNNLPPVGECEIEPIGGYGFVPSGFYLVLEIFRPKFPTGKVGTMRVNVFWAKGDRT